MVNGEPRRAAQARARRVSRQHPRTRISGGTVPGRVRRSLTVEEEDRDRQPQVSIRAQQRREEVPPAEILFEADPYDP